MCRRPDGPLPQEPKEETAWAMERLAATNFPEHLFGRIHQKIRNANREEHTWTGHWNWAHEGGSARTENVATRRRIDRLAELAEADNETEWLDLIEQAWWGEPLAAETTRGPIDVAGRAHERVGLYLAKPRTQNPMPISRDPRWEAPPLVTAVNVKFGKALNLDARRRDYERTFERVEIRWHEFAPVPRERLAVWEKTVLGAITDKSSARVVPGTREWFVGVSFDELIAVVQTEIEALRALPD